MVDTKKLFKVLVLGGMLAVQLGAAGCGSEPGQGAQQGAVSDGGNADGGVRVADGGDARPCVWGGDPCPC